ncbi:MAG: cytochrome c [Planctomycetes bacterium]|nr:cytochrome c [Planctomycetota bacterium]
MKVTICLGTFALLLAWGCGTEPQTRVVVGEVDGQGGATINGTVDADLTVDADVELSADVNCSIVCDLNTGSDCITVCGLGPADPPTPEELGLAFYLTNCSSCHGDPPGTGFAPNLAGESAADIDDELTGGSHGGGSFTLTQEELDNLAAYLATV